MWKLTAAEGERPPVFRMVRKGVKTLGRATRADFILDAPLVSRVHCRLSLTEAGDLEVEDLESTNGTFVNGRKVERATLASGDTLRVGRVDLAVERS